MDNSELHILWAAHRRMPFPADARGAEVEGVDLVLLDALAAGCISLMVEQVGQADSAKLTLLAELVQKIRAVSAHLDGETGQYFVHLKKVAEAALRAVHLDC